MEKVEFLTPSIKEIRKNIRNIDDSYNNPWDVLAELCQNAVDAIRIKRKKKKGYTGSIEIEINALEKSIRIKDDGIGINPDRLPKLLAPNSTDKDSDPDTIGEKGVGLTFVIFTSNYFEIKTGVDTGNSIRAVINGARAWKENENIDSLPVVEIDRSIKNFTGTEVFIKDVDRAPFMFLTIDQLEFLLRTHTAIGDTTPLWNLDYPEIRVTLKLTDINGEIFERTIRNSYWLPYESRDSAVKSLDYDDFIKKVSVASTTDDDKRRLLKGRIVYRKGEFKHRDNRIIKYIAVLVPRRADWEELNKTFGLWPNDDEQIEILLEDFPYIGFGPGIYTSVKGMPTGISIKNPKTGAAGYWHNIFILFEDRHLKFDIGRKSIHGNQAKVYQKYAKEIFNDFTKNIMRFYSGNIDIVPPWDKDEIFSKISQLPDLKSDKTAFLKIPINQEASVAAMFFELIGKGIIKDINPLVAGYKNKYDLYAKWENKNVVIEFKAKLSNILKDFDDARKLFNEIDCIVCWDVSDSDRYKLSEKGITIEEIGERSILDTEEDTIFPNSTHRLILSPYVKPVYVIDLRRKV